jgi:hypothetical protein
MISAMITFLGGSAFRMIWGELSAWLTARQEHKHELARIQLQSELDAAQHARNLEAIRVQAELGVQTIRVQGEADLAREDAAAFRDAVAASNRPSGIAWVDAWNASVRPAFATVVLVLWLLILHRQGYAPSPWDLDMMAAVAGFFFADRTLGKRGK